MMKLYLISLAAGLLVGVIYGVLNVRSPAPPVIALVGLLGILIGEQIVPLAKAALGRPSVSASTERAEPRAALTVGKGPGPSERRG